MYDYHPPEFETVISYVFEIKKAFHNLKQAPKYWFDSRRNFSLENKFLTINNDTSLSNQVCFFSCASFYRFRVTNKSLSKEASDMMQIKIERRHRILNYLRYRRRSYPMVFSYPNPFDVFQWMWSRCWRW